MIAVKIVTIIYWKTKKRKSGHGVKNLFNQSFRTFRTFVEKKLAIFFTAHDGGDGGKRGDGGDRSDEGDGREGGEGEVEGGDGTIAGQTTTTKIKKDKASQPMDAEQKGEGERQEKLFQDKLITWMCAEERKKTNLQVCYLPSKVSFN